MRSRAVTRRIWLVTVGLLTALGCAVSQQEFRHNFDYEPARAAGTMEGNVRLETSHALTPGVAETWKRWGNPQENLDNWRAAVAAALRDDMLRSGVIRPLSEGAPVDLVLRVEGSETEQPKSTFAVALSVVEPLSGTVASRYERRVPLGTSIFEYGEQMKRGMASMLAALRQELLADYQAGKLHGALMAARTSRAVQGRLVAAQAAQAKGDYVGALTAVRQARQADPAGAAPAAAAVTLLHRLCDPEGARRLGEAAGKTHPADAALQTARTGAGLTPAPAACAAQQLNREAVALAREGKRAEALAKFQAARQLAPGLVPKASYNAALLFEQAGNPQEALAAYLEARRGFLDPAEEQEALQRLTALAQRANLAVPAAADRRYRLGIVRAQQKRYPEAAAEFEAALAEAPWLADAYYNLGLVYDFIGRSADALQALQSYLGLAPQSPHASAVKTKVVELEDKLGMGGPPSK